MKKLILVTFALIFTALTAQAGGSGICPFAGDRNTKTVQDKVSSALGTSSKPTAK